MSFQLHKSFVCLQDTILDKNREACDCPIDCQVNNTVEVQKSIAREVGVCDIYIVCDIIVIVVLSMCNLTISSILQNPK